MVKISMFIKMKTIYLSKKKSFIHLKYKGDISV